jgi:hypothetical protein
MKRLSFVFVLCGLVPFLLGVSPFVRTDGEPQVQGPLRVYEPIYNFVDGFDQTVTTETKADLTLYVRTTGSDSNDCLSGGNACLTIQEAVDRVPRSISHAVTVDIGEGSFASFVVAKIHVSYPSVFTVRGTLGNPALGGATSGTATGGDTCNCVDAGAGWTPDELRGILMEVDGEYRVVRTNTATNAELVGALSASCNGKAYEVFEQKTVIDSGESYRIACWGVNPISRYSSFVLDSLKTSGGVIGFANGYNTHLIIRNCYATGAVYGILVQSAGMDAIELLDSYATACSAYGIYMFRIGGTRELNRIYAYNNPGHGVCVSGLMYANMGAVYADANTKSGVRVEYCQFTDIDKIEADGNSRYGVEIDENVSGNRESGSMVNIVGNGVVANNTLGGIIAKNQSTVALTNIDGAGNGNYGLELQTGSYATITTDTGITGATGDATINDGTTTLTWAVHFNDNGDIAVNLDSGVRIERKD